MSRATIVFFIIACIILSVHAKDVTIQVGEGGLSYAPQNAAAETGDNLVFVWSNGGTHSVVQSDGPDGSCTKSTKPNAFDSGPLSSGNFTYTITDTSGKIWYYCSIPGHCDSGMWGTVTIGGSVSGDYGYPVGDASAASGGIPSSTDSAPSPSVSAVSAASTTSVTILSLLGLVSSMIMVAFSMQ